MHAETQLVTYSGIIQADAYSGFNGLFIDGRKPGPIVEAVCWAYNRRKFFELARLRKMPIASGAVARIDALFAIECEINGVTVAERRTVRQTRSKPLLESFESWLRGERKKLFAERTVVEGDRLHVQSLARVHALRFAKNHQNSTTKLSSNSSNASMRYANRTHLLCCKRVHLGKHDFGKIVLEV